MNTVDSMIGQLRIFLEKQDHELVQNLAVTLQTQQYIQFQYRLLTSIRARSEAVDLRLRNEINLVR